MTNLLLRWTFYGTKTAKHTTIALFRLQHGMTVFTFVEKQAGINKHCFLLATAANRTGYY